MISQITQYVRSIANRHKEVNSFFAGNRDELNKDFLTYPLVFLEDNFLLNIVESNPDRASLTLVISVYNNEAYEKQMNPSYEDVKYNYIKETDDQVQTALLNRAFGILNDIVSLIDNEHHLTNYIIEAFSIETLVRQYNDDVAGATLNLNLTIPYTYPCRIDTIFGEEDLNPNSEFKD